MTIHLAWKFLANICHCSCRRCSSAFAFAFAHIAMGCNTWYFVGNWHDKLTVKGILDVISKVYLMLDRRCLNLSIFNSTKGSVVIGLKSLQEKGVESYVHWGGHASKIDGYRNQESLRNWTMMLKECSLVSLGEGILIDSLMN